MTIHLAGNLSATDRVVHEADHLAALAEKDKDIQLGCSLIVGLQDQIAALTDCLNGSSKAVYTAEMYDKLREQIAALTAQLLHEEQRNAARTGIIENKRKQIAALQASWDDCKTTADRLREMVAALQDRVKITNEWFAKYEALQAALKNYSVIDHKTIHTQQQRIKELESGWARCREDCRIAEKEARIKELESLLNVGDDPVWVSLHIEQRYEICRLEKRIKELTEALEKSPKCMDDICALVAKAALGGKV
jgi:DNA repair exonuclease SbcCD ATPase subunit